MKKIEYGGKNVYGYDIGILMLDSHFPRIEGDVGNAKTWDYPVLYKKVVGGTPRKVVIELTKEDIRPFIDAAKELEQEGVRAITTSCGFLALFQNEIAAEVNIPVFTSALLMVPMVQKMVGTNQKVAIMTANGRTLSKQHLESVGIVDDSNLVICGLEDGEEFTNFTVQNRMEVDTQKCREELLEHAKKMMDDNENIGAIVLECTNMPPYSKDIQELAQVPVFDIVSLTNMIHYGYNHPCR